MCCKIRSRSGELIPAVEGIACDDEAIVAKTTRPDNQRLGIAAVVCLKQARVRKEMTDFRACRDQPHNGARQICDGSRLFRVRVAPAT
jgi:hypothetical protein